MIECIGYVVSALVGSIITMLYFRTENIGTLFGDIHDESGSSLLVQLDKSPSEFKKRKRVSFNVVLKNTRNF